MKTLTKNNSENQKTTTQDSLKRIQHSVDKESARIKIVPDKKTQN